jgi:hypothetical protein
MPKDAENPSRNPAARLHPTQPLPPEAAEFARAVSGMLNGEGKDPAAVENALLGMDSMFDLIAAGLYTLASMLVGEGEDAIRLVETSVAKAEVSAGSKPEQARLASRRALAAAALELLQRRDPASLAAPEGLGHARTCIEDDDLDSAGMSRDELESMISGPDRDRVRAWLESLPASMRVIFVLRAVAGFSGQKIAELLIRHAGPRAAGWSADDIRELFRQALCSLASQMLKAGKN